MTDKAFADYMADVIAPAFASHRYVAKESRDLIVALEQRIAALERKPTVKFCGVFENDKVYAAGDACVHKSALWICRAPTTGAPGEDFIGWQLAIKKGDAGR